jgi:vacuolar-type H+-ATPase subunit E/Vma4
MMMVEDVKKDFNNSLKEIQENTAKQVEDLKEEAQKSLKELQKNTTNNYFSLISLNINGLNSPIKRHRLTD